MIVKSQVTNLSARSRLKRYIGFCYLFIKKNRVLLMEVFASKRTTVTHDCNRVDNNSATVGLIVKL
jgi:hypothetical protein